MRIASRYRELSLALNVVVVYVVVVVFCRHGGRRARRETETKRGPTARAPVRDYVSRFLFLFLFFLVRVRAVTNACLIVSFLFSLSLSLSLLVQMAPSIRAAKVLGNLAKINERAILGAEVTPGLCQARNI